jgi:hypothetical protein
MPLELSDGLEGAISYGWRPSPNLNCVAQPSIGGLTEHGSNGLLSL